MGLPPELQPSDLSKIPTSRVTYVLQSRDRNGIQWFTFREFPEDAENAVRSKLNEYRAARARHGRHWRVVRRTTTDQPLNW